MNRQIEKKCWSEYFNKVLSGEKNFEVRLNDFECSSGDIIILKEWNPQTKQYTGRTIRKKIGYIVRTEELNFWSREDVENFGYQILSLEED